MNEKQLKAFLRVAELGSFSKAAKEAQVTSPALISQVNTLEKQFGFQLFHRSTHSVQLTPEGKVFFKAAEEMLDIFNNFKQSCVELSNRRELRIAVSGEGISDLGIFASAFMIKHPDINVSFTQLNGYELNNQLKSGKVDLTFGAEPAESLLDNIHFIPVFRKNFSILAKCDHPLASLEVVTIEDLKNSKVKVWERPLSKVDPVKKMEGIGVLCESIKDTSYDIDCVNEMLRGSVILSSFIEQDESCGFSRTIPTDIDAGYMGFVLPQKAKEDAENFVSEYVEYYSRENSSRRE